MAVLQVFLELANDPVVPLNFGRELPVGLFEIPKLSERLPQDSDLDLEQLEDLAVSEGLLDARLRKPLLDESLCLFHPDPLLS